MDERPPVIAAARWVARRYARAWRAGPLRAVDWWDAAEFRVVVR